MLAWLESSQFSAGVRNELWGWPLALTVHAFGTALVVGLTFIITLRLLGLFEAIPYSSLNRLFPVMWVALAVQFLSGFVLFPPDGMGVLPRCGPADARADALAGCMVVSRSSAAVISPRPL